MVVPPSRASRAEILLSPNVSLISGGKPNMLLPEETVASCISCWSKLAGAQEMKAFATALGSTQCTYRWQEHLSHLLNHPPPQPGPIDPAHQDAPPIPHYCRGICWPRVTEAGKNSDVIPDKLSRLMRVYYEQTTTRVRTQQGKTAAFAVYVGVCHWLLCTNFV